MDRDELNYEVLRDLLSRVSPIPRTSELVKAERLRRRKEDRPLEEKMKDILSALEIYGHLYRSAFDLQSDPNFPKHPSDIYHMAIAEKARDEVFEKLEGYLYTLEKSIKDEVSKSARGQE